MYNFFKGLFTEGFEKNLTNTMKRDISIKLLRQPYISACRIIQKPYFVKADMSKFLALIIDSLNHDITIGAVMNPTDKIHALLEKYARRTDLIVHTV